MCTHLWIESHSEEHEEEQGWPERWQGHLADSLGEGDECQPRTWNDREMVIVEDVGIVKISHLVFSIILLVLKMTTISYVKQI